MIDIDSVPGLGNEGGADTTPVSKEKDMSGPGTQKTKECGADTPMSPRAGTHKHRTLIYHQKRKEHLT